jgi:hypothetical protein
MLDTSKTDEETLKSVTEVVKKSPSLKEKTALKTGKRNKLPVLQPDAITNTDAIVLTNTDTEVVLDNDSSILFLCSIIYVLMGLN